MDNKLKMAGLLAAGYLLGRTKKLKLALTVASSVAGVAGYSKREMFSEAIFRISENTPELQVLTDKITGRLVDSGKSAAYSMVTMGVDQVSQKLQERIDKINDSLESPAQTSAESADESEEGTDEAPEDQVAEGDQAAEEGEPAEAEAEEEEQEPAEDDEAVAEEPTDDEAAEAEAEEEPAEAEEQDPAEKEEKASAKRTSSSQRASSSGSRAATLSQGEARKIREWARENDIEVSSRGRIRKDVVQAYRNATKG